MSRHIPLQFDNNQTSTAQTVSKTQFVAFQIGKNQNSGKLASEMSLPKVAQTKVSNIFRSHITKLEIVLAMEIERINQTMEIFPLQNNIQKLRYPPCLLYTSQPLNFPLTPENLFTNHQTAIHPPLLNILAIHTVGETRNKFQIGLSLESNCFCHKLKYKQKQTRLKTTLIYKPQKNYIKLPPITN